MGGLVWFDKTVQACKGPTSLVIFRAFPCFSQWWFSHDLFIGESDVYLISDGFS
jgi:hypothetical protein